MLSLREFYEDHAQVRSKEGETEGLNLGLLPHSCKDNAKEACAKVNCAGPGPEKPYLGFIFRIDRSWPCGI